MLAVALLVAHREREREERQNLCFTRRMRNVYNIIKHTSRAPPTMKKTPKKGPTKEKKEKFNLLAFYEPKSKSLTIIKKRKPTEGGGMVWPRAKTAGELVTHGRTRGGRMMRAEMRDESLEHCGSNSRLRLRLQATRSSLGSGLVNVNDVDDGRTGTAAQHSTARTVGSGQWAA